MPSLLRKLAIVPLVAAAIILPACQSSYAVDVRSQASIPVYVQIVERTNSGGAVLKASERLGPGDRKAVGPVRMKTGSAMVVVDSRPNPNAPTFLDLSPGTTFLEVSEEGVQPVRHEGSRLRIREVPR
jgi:hypothetical protein